GFKEERKLSYGVQYLQVGNGTQAAVEAIGMFDLVLPSGLVLKLNNCYYAPSIVRGVVSLSCLLDLGFHHTIASNGIFKCECLLENIDEESFDKCESCISGKMTKKPFNKNIERATDLLGLIHTDVCEPLRHVSRKGASYFLTFTDDFSLQNLTSPYTPQQNGVSERRNRTLLDMVRSMFNLTTLPLSYWDYALESAVCILNMVPTKKVDKTPYEIWHGKAPNLSYLKVWGCEAYVKQPESLGPPSELIPVRRSERTTHAPNHLCLNMKVKDNEVGDLEEPANYKTVMLDPDKVIWQGAMDVEMKSMKVNKVWIVVDRPPNAKVVRNKWLYKKKTDMDGKIHTYKARLVAKGCTQTFEIDYQETFSPVADIRAIRFLIAISAYYDYKIWKMDVKTAFLNGRLDEDIYMEQP
nr:retrotransposon protein, putative, Ty1-copia subclass [Tanacetum cinerariifolium]